MLVPQIPIHSVCKHLLSLCNAPKCTLHTGDSVVNRLNPFQGVFMLGGNLLYLFLCVYVCEYVCMSVFMCAYMHFVCACVVCVQVCVCAYTCGEVNMKIQVQAPSLKVSLNSFLMPSSPTLTSASLEHYQYVFCQQNCTCIFQNFQ